ncbi:S-layer protein [Lactobacillus helveticus]|nr:SLAP domain-containing protein [Lactobacillus helveticus]NRO62487.1 S-layer protein [Lactobacillus helveticus]
MLDRSNNTQFTLSLNSTQEASLLQQLNAPAGAKISNVVVEKVTAQNANGELKQYFTFDVVNEKDKTIESSTGVTNAKFASQQGTPYFYDVVGNTVINNGSTVTVNNIANGFTPSSLLKEINDKYASKTSDASGSKAEMTTTASDVESQLVAQGLKRASNGDFDYPANGFNLKLTAKSENGNTASITVRINATVNYNAPVFVFDKKVYFNNNLTADGTTSGQLVLRDTKDTKVIVNGELNNEAVTDAVTVYVQSAYGDSFDKFDRTVTDLEKDQQKINPSNIHIDSSKVNASVAGMYPVTITATNPAGFTSKLVVYAIVMGQPQNVPAQYVNVDSAKVYNINGNVVTEDSSVEPLAKGAAVYTLDSVTVNGVKYTEINKKGSNQWVKASDLTATAPAPAVADSVSKTIMHNAYYYNKEGQRVGTEKATRYDLVAVAPKTTTFNGKTYYQVVENGKAVDKYINADNIDGTKRTLKHNAYVYKSSKKRANKVVLKKGTEVTTYGGSYKFKNGKKYYKIGAGTKKTYVRVENFD